MQRRKYSVTPLQISSPMQETLETKPPIITNNQKIQKQMSGLRSFFSCKYNQTAIEVDKKKKKQKNKLNRIGCSASLCNIKESSKVHIPSNDNNLLANATPISTSSSNLSSSIYSSSSSSSSLNGSFRGMHLRKLSGCYECHMVVDPITGISSMPSLRRCNIFSCSECGEIFAKKESLELHQSMKHAVSDLGPEDNSRNIVEIIFKSSWLKKQPSTYKIQRILKIHNTQNTISKFEAYRDFVKAKANKLQKNHSRCVADGNELLRFCSTTLNCSLGLNRSNSLCISTQTFRKCNVCSIIKHGFELNENGKVGTMATSGRAHDTAKFSLSGGNKERAMLVCRVIAGRVSSNKNQESGDEFDSCASNVGVYSSFDELFVFDPKAILPCFVIIYKSI